MLNKIILGLLISPIIGLIFGWLSRYIRQWFYVLFSGAVLVLIVKIFNSAFNFSFSLLGFRFKFVFDNISVFFLLLIWGIGFLIYFFSLPQLKKKSDNIYYFLFQSLLIVTSILTLSRDFLGFFFFWELMSLLTFIITVMYKPSRKAAVKYFVFSIFGAYSMLIGILILYGKIGSFDFITISNSMTSLSVGLKIGVFFLISVNFLIKGAVVPFYVWLPDLHGKAEGKFSVFLSSVLLKFSILGMIILYFVLFVNSTISYNVNLVIGYLAAISFLVASFVAVFQSSAKRLLAYSSIANIGYAITAIMLGNSLGFYGGMFHIINHTIFKGLLFLIVAGVVFRTGTDNLDELGGLIKRMPLSFVGMLIAIIAVAGVPPMNGFVSKWMIYSSLFNSGEYLALIFMLVSSTVSFLYVYRLIHGIFLGQIQEKHLKVKELPLSMLLPVIILALGTMFLGSYPGYALKLIDKIAFALGINQIPFTLTKVTMQASTLNARFVASLFMGIFGFTFLLFVILSKSRRVSQYDNYNAGQILTPEQPYHYTENFYRPFQRTVEMWIKYDLNKFYNVLKEYLNDTVDMLRKIYSGDLQFYIIVIIAVLAVLLGIFV